MVWAAVRSILILLIACYLLLPLWEAKIVVCFVVRGEERAGCFAWFVFLVCRDGCVALPRGAMGFSVVCDCDIS